MNATLRGKNFYAFKYMYTQTYSINVIIKQGSKGVKNRVSV